MKELKHNLLNIFQLCDKGYSITFKTLIFIIEHKSDNKMMFKGSSVDNIYMSYIDEISNIGTKCLVTWIQDSWLWHRHIGHVHFNLIHRIAPKNLVIGLRKIKLSKEKLCDAF